jgi:peptidoglycan/LPS O-acetylase OafA/YrhL
MSGETDPAARPDGEPRYAGGTIPSLDGIRAVSVCLVLFSHAGLSLLPGGFGVTIFFVLSGYLITTLMRREFAQRGSIDFPAFYLRRFLRLMPPLAVVAGLSVAVGWLLSVGGPFTWTGLASVLFYFSNYFLISHQDYSSQPPGLGVTWSLAVEEHYYLLFPPLALVLMRFRRRLHSALVLGSLCTAILLWRCWLQSHGASTMHLEFGTDTRVDAILIGCLMAMVRNPWLDPLPPKNKLRDLAVLAGCLLLLAATLVWRDEYFRMTLRYSVQCLLIAVVMYLAVARYQDAPFRWLNLRPVAYLGTISYTMYLAHYLVLLTMEQYASALGPGAVITLTAGVTIVIAALMRELVEKPCAVLRHRLHEKFSTRRPALRPAVGGPS